MQPAFWGFDGAHLNAGEGVVEFFHDWPDLFHAAGEADLFAVVVDLADWGDNGGGAAEAAFNKFRHFGEEDFALFHLHAEDVLSDVGHGAAGDGWQDGVRFWRDEGAILGDEEEVCAAGFFNLGAGCWVEIHIFSKSCFVCFLAGVEAHGVVEACFDVTGAVWGCAVKIGDGDLDRFDAALEIWADWHADHAEFKFWRWRYADDRTAAVDEWTDVEGGAGAVWWNVVDVGLDELVEGIEEFFFGNGWDAEAFAGIVQTLCVQIWTEGDDAAVFGAVRFEPFKSGLRILQHAGAFGNMNDRIGDEAAFVPFAIFPGRNITIICSSILETEAAPINIFCHKKHSFTCITTVCESIIHPETECGQKIFAKR